MANQTKKNQVKSEDTKSVILRSAEKLFAEQGFETTTVREIARDSGANIAMVYYYFQNKEGLYQDILENSLKSHSVLLNNCVDSQKSPEENIYSVIKVYINFFQNNKAIQRIIHRETISQSKHIEMIVKKYISKNFDLIRGIIQQGVQRGVFREQDTALITISLIGMIRSYFTCEQVITRLISSEKREISEYLPDHIFDLFMRGVKR